MIWVHALAVALLAGAGAYLLLGRTLFRAILGISLLAHAANLVVLAAGNPGETAPVLSAARARLETADPLPQALVLTAIVISMAVTLYLLGLLRANASSFDSVAIERPLSDDADRDPEQVARELDPGGESR